MKKLIAPIALGLSMLIATPTFAYTVKSGDTMSQIAVNNNLSLDELKAINPQIENLNLIYVGQNINTTLSSPSKNLSPYEKDLLARLVHAEANGEPYSGKVAVAVVVLNRVDSPLFPNSVEGVIEQPGQFEPVTNGTINEPADADSIKAVEDALNEDRSLGGGSLFFYNPLTSSSHWLDSRPTTIIIGHHIFKK